jgi:hypothetical protein
MDAQKSAVEHAAQGPHTEPHPGGSHARVTLTVLVLCAMFMSLLAPGATAATISKATAGLGAQQVVSAAPGNGKKNAISLARTAPAEVHGVAADGTPLNGTSELKRFRERGGVLYAVGTLTASLGEKPVRQNVSLPVTGASNEVPAVEGAMQQQAPVPTPGACDILTFALGPLDLDLLGLRVALDPINLLIEAIPGAGNLLGNLLCGIAGLLDGPLGGGLGNLLRNLLGAIADLLNGILGA